MEKVVYNAWNHSAADMMVELLKENGIDAFVKHHDFGSDVFVEAVQERNASKVLSRYTA